jgi:S-adenosylmethionine-diacylglycerol 3-amino-3-carboxypropyl transferase
LSGPDGPAWVDAAAALPLAFAQVREDSLIDLAVVERLQRPARVLMVASGGCTAALLAASGKADWLHLVDPNRAQIALTRLKLMMLAEIEPGARGQILGHAPMPPQARKKWLADALDRLELAADALGPVDFVVDAGPDYSGRYERVFLALCAALGEHVQEMEAVLRLSDPRRQQALFAPETPLGQALDAALAQVMALPNLVRLFGREATQNPLQDFQRHFSERLRHVVSTLPAASNPYLWQMLLGRYPEAMPVAWLAAPRAAKHPRVTWECDFMLPVLERSAGSFDFVHLSNILDWLPAARAAETLRHASAALRPGGCVLVRQLNSSLDIRALGPQFRWQDDAGRELHERDRSFFYRALHWGFRG